MTKPYRYVPGSLVDKVLKALDAAAVPMSRAQLCDAIEYTGTPGVFINLIRRAVDKGVIDLSGRLYTRGRTPTVIRERRASYDKPALHAWRTHIQAQAVVVSGNLRTLMDDGASVGTGDPLRALADAMDAARAVLAAGRTSQRFAGAEVELLVARELRSVTVAAQLATTTLNEALEVLK